MGDPIQESPIVVFRGGGSQSLEDRLQRASELKDYDVFYKQMDVFLEGEFPIHIRFPFIASQVFHVNPVLGLGGSFVGGAYQNLGSNRTYYSLDAALRARLLTHMYVDYKLGVGPSFNQLDFGKGFPVQETWGFNFSRRIGMGIDICIGRPGCISLGLTMHNEDAISGTPWKNSAVLFTVTAGGRHDLIEEVGGSCVFPCDGKGIGTCIGGGESGGQTRTPVTPPRDTQWCEDKIKKCEDKNKTCEDKNRTCEDKNQACEKDKEACQKEVAPLKKELEEAKLAPKYAELLEGTIFSFANDNPDLAFQLNHFAVAKPNRQKEKLCLSIPQLDRFHWTVRELLKQIQGQSNIRLRVKIWGFANETGISPEHNRKLALARSAFVYDYYTRAGDAGVFSKAADVYNASAAKRWTATAKTFGKTPLCRGVDQYGNNPILMTDAELNGVIEVTDEAAQLGSSYDPQKILAEQSKGAIGLRHPKFRMAKIELEIIQDGKELSSEDKRKFLANIFGGAN